MQHITNFTETSTSFARLEALMEQSLLMRQWARQHGAGLTETEQVLSFSQRLVEDLFAARASASVETIMQNRTAWLLRWAASAFPRIRMGHQLAAMLMATTIAPSEMDHVMAPWPAFLLEVPTALLPVRQQKDTESFAEILRIHVNTEFLPGHFKDGPHWALELSGPRIEVHRVGPLAELASLRRKRGPTAVEDVNVRIDEPDEPLPFPRAGLEADYDWSQDERVAVLATRLVVGACVFMTNRAEFTSRNVRLGSTLGVAARRLGIEPESQLYTLCRPVRIDVRPALAAYLSGESRSPTVQSFVAGHHKRQPCGTGGQDRKWIYVEPYWRGPEDAPIAVRPHVHG